MGTKSTEIYRGKAGTEHRQAETTGSALSTETALGGWGSVVLIVFLN